MPEKTERVLVRGSLNLPPKADVPTDDAVARIQLIDTASKEHVVLAETIIEGVSNGKKNGFKLCGDVSADIDSLAINVVVKRRIWYYGAPRWEQLELSDLRTLVPDPVRLRSDGRAVHVQVYVPPYAYVT